MGILKKVKEKVKSMAHTRIRKTDSMIPKAGVGNHSKYSDGGKLRKKK